MDRNRRSCQPAKGLADGQPVTGNTLIDWLITEGICKRSAERNYPSALFLPFDVLKIDRSFVGRITEGAHPSRSSAPSSNWRALNLSVVAEGIETREQYQMLKQMACQSGQGYYIAKPMPAKEVGALLNLPGRLLPEPEMLAAQGFVA